jgi:two-component system, NtrC family, sensor histidine kinase HydH
VVPETNMPLSTPRPLSASRGAPYEDFEQIRGDALRVTFATTRWAKMLLLEPAFFGIAAYVALTANDPGRRLGAAVNLTLLLIVNLARPILRPRAAACLRWLLGAHLVALSGGLESPLFPFVLVVVLSAPLWFERDVARATAAAFIGYTWLLTLLELTSGSHAPSALEGVAHGARHALVYAACMTSLIVAAYSIGRALRQASDEMLRRSLAARDETLRTHDERLRELTIFSAEIAHELKNPLASIKGLTALMKLDPERAPERLEVLSAEVNRMQEKLEAFLNFSRPLTPLSLDEIDLRTIILDVVDLHAGLANDKRISFDTRTVQSAELRCDRRKLQQILMNLIQNAIDASSVGGTIELRLMPVGERIRLSVLDRGPGVSEAQLQTLFEPGVTTKAKGSGLGLTIVRALVEQHAGTIALRNRSAGGLAVEIDLCVNCPPPGAPLL